MAIDISKFIHRFADEAREHIARLEDGLGALHTERDGGRVGVDVLFRSAHTIKGTARMLKLASIADTAHHLEDVLGALREGRISADPALGALLMRAVDTLSKMIEQVAARGVAEDAPLDPALCEWLARAAGGDWSTPTAGPVPATMGSDADAPAPPPPSSTAASPEATGLSSGLRSPDSVRVRMDKLDELIRLMGEMVSNQARLRHCLSEARNLDAAARRGVPQANRDTGPSTGRASELARAWHAFTLNLRDLTLDQERLIGELNDRTLSMRMLPLGMVLDPLARGARELGRSLGKEVQCEVSGSEIELDRHLIDHLNEALVHLLRNAIDHGIEPAAARLAAGKPALGRIRLSARQEGNTVLITIADDGCGLDRTAIVDQALHSGLIAPALRHQITDEQVADLIFQPGFSTSRIITEVSGRGVGMDVVRRVINDELQGSVSIASQTGAGTTLTLKLPLSLAVMRILLLEAGGYCFGLTASHVVELIRTSPAESIQVAGRPAVILRNELVPIIPLTELLGLDPPAESGPRRRHGQASEAMLVVIIGVHANTQQAKLGLVVDALIDERDMVLKPLPAHMRSQGCGSLVGGVLVTGTNDLVSLLQAPALLELARRLRGEAIKAAAREAVPRPGPHQEPHILVVDDSLNTREIEKEVLEAFGYRVTLAVDGLDGWQKAIGGHFDAILTDVEMPGLDGFSLTAKLRENEKFRDTPILIVTSRQTPEDKQRGIQVGADAYIVKGDFDQSALVDTLRNLLG